MKMARLLRFAAVFVAAHAAWVGTEDGSFRPSWMSFDMSDAAEFFSSTADSIVSWARDSPLQRGGRRGGTSGAAPSPVAPLVEVLLAKLQHLRVTELVAGDDADALGALAIDAAWLDAAGLFPGQRVELGRVRAGRASGASGGGGGGGARTGRSIFTTVRAGARGSGVVSLDAGAAAELAGGAPDGAPRIGDRVSVAAYGQMTREQYAAFKPRVLLFAASDADEGADVRGGGARGAPEFRMLHVESENDKLAVQSPPLGEPQGDGTAMQPPPLETPDVIYQDVPK